ncbi:MAG: ligase-associated DNA damage response DEXH box helicase [Methylobacteriaceae bacterium]|nr:ligase-associated DNA damage response DEXH box helicase [Methylobacteriaceae bacterium]
MTADALPARFESWFAARGWFVRPHQRALVRAAQAGRDALLIAPTGAGKTLAGFLPSLIDIAEGGRANRPGGRLHTLYISPLKALAVDVHRNLEIPVSEMKLPVRIETRTGDTSAQKRQRQRRDPPDMLLTTPEQLALLIASPDAPHLFGDLRRVVLDELHALSQSKRGDLLALGLARLRSLAPAHRVTGLSATVRDPRELRRYIVGRGELADLVTAPPGAPAELSILDTEERLPWSGHSARHALAEIYAAIGRAKMTLIFVNTRAQAEFVFQELWRINEHALPIALHHGSLDAGQRRKVEAAMSDGRLRAVVCTSTLDLGIDWGDVDLVVNVGAPKGASRLMQRIGRANHRLDESSRALLVPANRFEVLECVAAVAAAREGAQDTPVARLGGLDVLCQHILGSACMAPFAADDLYAEISSAAPYAGVARETFDRALAFVATGGYALKSYDRFAKIKRNIDGVWRIANARVAQAYRMNVGVIVEEAKLKVRLTRSVGKNRGPSGPQNNASLKARGPDYTGPLTRGGRVLGEIEEYFIETLAPGDTFLFGGEILALQGIVENEALVRRAQGDAPKIPSYMGGKFPLSTYLAERVRGMLASPASWKHLPEQVRDWLGEQRKRSVLPKRDNLLVETFPRGNRFFTVAYPFEGRLAHQTLGMLLTRRMERSGLKPLGFVANDYAMAVWSLADTARADMAALFNQDMLGDDLDAWLQESALMKRTFRNCAIVAHLIEMRFPGKEKTGRQATVSTDLIYDVLRRHEPEHILLEAAYADAATGLLDIGRLSDMLHRVQGRITHRALDRISPLAVPVMLEIGKEPIYGEARDEALRMAAEELIEEAHP